jgi:tetratricopeptide (TPR) repeat protein
MKSKTSVEQQIKMYSMMKTDNSYYLKGKALMELAEITGEKGHVKEAIEAYSEAIKLKQDSTYLCERAKAYSQIGLSKEAVMDFKSAQSVDNGSDILKNYHTQTMLQDLATLDNIKSTVKQLREEGVLPKEFLDSYDDLVDVVTGIRVKVAEQDEKITYIMQQLSEIKSGMQQGEDVGKLTEKFKILANKVYEIDQKVEILLVVNDIVYDNDLLNHPELLKLSVKELGMSRVLDMSNSLSSELISEAIQQNNAELLLAGCISLDCSDVI